MSSHAIKMILDDWAKWSRNGAVKGGWTNKNVLVNGMVYGIAMRPQFKNLTPFIPPDMQIVDDALLRLRKEDQDAYTTIRECHLLGRGDVELAKKYKVASKTCQRWRERGYKWLAIALGILELSTIDKNVQIGQYKPNLNSRL